MTTIALGIAVNVYDDAGFATLRAVHTHDGTRLIGIGGYIKSPGDIVVWDTTIAKKLTHNYSNQISLSMLAISPDDRHLAVAGSSIIAANTAATLSMASSNGRQTPAGSVT